MPYQIPDDAIVSNQGPQSMSRWPSLPGLSRLFGGGARDINLPPEGPADPNLPPSPMQQLQKAFAAGNKIATEPDALTGLRNAGRP